MADCSKTEVFLAEWDRLCKTVLNSVTPYCEKCPARRYCPNNECDCNDETPQIEIIEIIQKWSDEHPAPKQKTYADVLFETFPFAKINKFGNPDVCMRSIVYGDNNCVACAKKYGTVNCDEAWEEPYQKPEEKQ